MKLKEYFKTIENKKAFVELCGCTNVYLWQIMNGKRRPGPALAKAIEEKTNGAVSRMELLYPEEFKKAI